MSGPSLLFLMPGNLKVYLAPRITGNVFDIKNHARPAVVVCNDMNVAGGTWRTFRSLVMGNWENASNFRHADVRALSKNIIERAVGILSIHTRTAGQLLV
jgi:hypothetical protein